MNRILARSAASLLLCAAMNFASAGSGTGTVKTLLAGPLYGSLMFVGIDGITGKPGCSTNTNFAFVIDTNATYAKVWVALLQEAHAAGKSVFIQGSNTCSLYADVEGVQYIWVQE